MARFLQLAFATALFAAGPALAQDAAGFPPGFTESVAFDPVSARPVQIIVGGKAGAPLVVLIHGLGQNASRDWLPVLPALARGYRVLVLDLPGFGRSEDTDAALTPLRYARLVHWLIAQHADEPVHVIGHSMGAAVALRHSYDYPQQVRRLLLIDAAGILETTVFARHLARVPSKVEGPTALRRLVAKGSRLANAVSGRLQDLTADKADKLRELAGSDRARDLLYKDRSTVNAALALANEDFSPVLRDIRPPVWMLWGEQDPVAPLRTGQALHWLLPRSELTVLPAVGHVPMRDATGRTIEWMLAALEGAPPRPAAAQPGPSQGDVYCKDKKDHVYRGRWGMIRLDNCPGTRIEDATIAQLQVNRSTVTLNNVTIASEGTALEATRSNIVATGLRIDAPRAFALKKARLDIAAAHIQAASMGNDQEESLLYFSLGYWCDGVAEWRLHDVWKLRPGELDSQLHRVNGGACTRPD